MEWSPPIHMDILLSNWDKCVAVFTDFPGSLNKDYIIRQLKRRKVIMSTVTQLDANGTYPLLEFLRSPNCSSKVLKLLFLNGVDVNANNISRHSALVTALHHHAKKPSIIKAILKAGAEVNTLPFYENCALCVAINNQATPDVIKMLLREGCRPNCGERLPALFLATKYRSPKRRREVLKLLIDGGASLQTLTRDGRSALCFALQKAVSRKDIDLLINLGIPTDACNVHGSPILCALDTERGRALRSDVAESLLGPFENPMRGHDYLYTIPYSVRKPLRYELGHYLPRFELERFESRMEDEYGTLLHAVTYNVHCTPDLIDLLTKRGVPVDKQSSEGETALHVVLKAGRNEQNILNVLEALLKRGCPVNAKDWAGRTPLAVAVLLEMDCKVLKVLLDASARVTRQNGCEEISVLETALDHHSYISCYERLEKTIRWEWPNIPGKRKNWLYLTESLIDIRVIQEDTKWKCLTILLLYSFLENPELDVECLTQGRSDQKLILSFTRNCLLELRELEQKEVGNGCTLLEIIRRPMLPKVNTDHNLGENNFDFDKLLKVLVNTKFNLYFNMILDRVPRELMEMKLHQLRMCTMIHYPHLQIFILNYQCVCEIAKYLSNNDLMTLFLTFNNCIIPTGQLNGVINEVESCKS